MLNRSKKIVLITLTCGLSSGCSINQFGFLETRHIAAQGSVVVETRAPGFHLDTIASRVSVTFGYFKQLSVFPMECSIAPDGSVVRQFGPWDPVFVTRAYGLHLGKYTGVTLGFHEYAHLLEVDKSQGGGRLLELNLENIEKTRLLNFGSSSVDECLVVGQ